MIGGVISSKFKKRLLIIDGVQNAINPKKNNDNKRRKGRFM